MKSEHRDLARRMESKMSILEQSHGRSQLDGNHLRRNQHAIPADVRVIAARREKFLSFARTTFGVVFLIALLIAIIAIKTLLWMPRLP